MVTPIFKGTVSNGKLKIADTTSFNGYLHTLPPDVEVIIRARCAKSRSSNQNRYYFGVVIRLLSEHTGYTKDECHELMKGIFLTEKVVIQTNHGDKIMDAPKSTTSLTTKEMEEYLESIRGWCAYELSLSIPEPEEVEI